MEKLLNFAIRMRFLQHLIFWTVSYIILLNMFQVSAQLARIDYIYTAIFQMTIMAAVYVNLFIFIPRLLNVKKLLLFIILALMLVTAASYLNILLYRYIIDFLLPGYYFISYYSFIDVAKYMAVFVLLSSLLKLSKEWFRLSETNRHLSQLAREKAEIELKALRGQINPHFLFNSLNVLYSSALKESKDLPGMIIQLSDILRYVIYQSNKDFVTINDEIKLLSDYLGLQQFRIGERSSVNFSTKIHDEEARIAPMLFLPLVENSFKHGIKGDITETFINLELKTTESDILFEIENNKGSPDTIENNSEGGIGLNNIKHRLNLIYPRSHKLEIEETDNHFKIVLWIKNEN